MAGIGVQDHRNLCSGSRNPRSRSRNRCSRWIGISVQDGPEYAVLSVLATGFLVLRRYRDIGFGILTFFVLLLPLILVPRPNLIFEYRVYGSFAGIAIALGSLVAMRRRPLIVAMTVALVVALGIRTFGRSAEWNDDVAFYEANRFRFPNDPHVLIALAVSYYNRGDVSRALETMEQAQRHEGRLNAYYSKRGRVDIAANLVSFAAMNEDYEKAGRELSRALSLHPFEPRILLTAGIYYLEIDESENALAAFQQLTELEPSGVSGWAGMREAYARLGNAEAAGEAMIRLSALRDDQSARPARPWRISPRYRTPVIFILLGVVVGSTFIALRWVWVMVRQ